MDASGKKPVIRPPRNAWDTTLDRIEASDPAQLGEPDPTTEDDPRRRGESGRDADTGDGGYGGDAGEAGHEAAASQPDRPTDDEIHGDPRTHAGEPYPDDAKVSEAGQQPFGETSEVRED